MMALAIKFYYAYGTSHTQKILVQKLTLYYVHYPGLKVTDFGVVSRISRFAA